MATKTPDAGRGGPVNEAFTPVAKAAMDAIRDSLEPEEAGSAMLTYLAVARLANDKGAESIEVPIGLIAHNACLNRRTVERRLVDLERLGAIRVERQRIPGTKANGFSRYTLTTLSRDLATPSHHLTTQTGLHRVAVLKEQEEHQRESVVPPMSREEFDREFSTRPWTQEFKEWWWNALEACNWTPKNHNRPLDRKGVGHWLANRWPSWQARSAKARGSRGITETPAEREARIEASERDAEARKRKEIADAKALGIVGFAPGYLEKLTAPVISERERNKATQNPDYHHEP